MRISLLMVKYGVLVFLPFHYFLKNTLDGLQHDSPTSLVVISIQVSKTLQEQES